MSGELDKIRKAYDLTAEQYKKGIDTYAAVPEHIQNMPGYRDIINNPSLGSGALDIREYLKPKTGMRFLDAGCCANLVNYRLDKWPCIYYGIDISPMLIDAMKSFVEKNRISSGGLYNTDLANMPFDDGFFDIASVIGILEYCTLEYTERALHELQRVLKPTARIALDIPNLAHPYIETMLKLEEHLGRPNIPKARPVFERILALVFVSDRVDDSGMMIRYFGRMKR
jgi:SAM-dependent methyltransferase